MRIDENELKDGLHYFSGVGTAIVMGVGESAWDDEDEGTFVDAFCIDGKLFAAFEDPDDGYRSYGCIREVSKEDSRMQYFKPQAVMIQHIVECAYPDALEDGWDVGNDDYLIMTDAVTGKEIMRIGTSYADNYYPVAIFRYFPQSMAINANR